jgi:hypothetical protein
MSELPPVARGTFVNAIIAVGEDDKGKSCEGLVGSYSDENPSLVIVRGLSTDYVCTIRSLRIIPEEEIPKEVAELYVPIRQEILRQFRVEERIQRSLLRPRVEVQAQCDPCEGTGILLSTSVEGTGSICGDCDGSGMRIISYVPFTGRVPRNVQMLVSASCVRRSEANGRSNSYG